MSSYLDAVAAEDERLRGTLAAIHADEESGGLTAAEAADNRIAAMEAHLAKCRDLRIEHFGPQPTDQGSM